MNEIEPMLIGHLTLLHSLHTTLESACVCARVYVCVAFCVRKARALFGLLLV